MTKLLLDDPMAQVMEYWQILRHHKWWIFFPTLGLSLASAVAIALLPDQYRATTTILVDPQRVSDQYVNPAVKEVFTNRLQTISQQVLSTSRLEEIIKHYNLYADLRKSLPREQVIAYMQNDITIDVNNRASGDGPSTFTITYLGRNPKLVAEVANELAAQFIEWNLRNREQVAQVTTEFLSDQLREAKRSLETQEAKLRDFKLRHMGEMPENLPAILGSLAQLRAEYQANNDALNRLEQERIELTLLPGAGVSGGRPNEPLGERGQLEMEKLRLEGELVDMQRRYTPAHPAVVEVMARLHRVREQLKALPALSAENDTSGQSPSAVRLNIIARQMSQLKEQQKKISEQIAAYQAKVDAVPLREQQVADLARDYDISKERYRSLLAKEYSAEMASDLEHKQEGVRFTVLDPARAPEQPVKPNRPVLMVAAVVGSLLLSVGLVLLKERLDTTLKAEKQLEELLPPQVTVLASIPTIDTPADQQRRLRFTIFALGTALFACLGVATLLWRIHPIFTWSIHPSP